ncbi:hypothetical protein CDL15_Pgr012746 [Punica granatum]|uniref:Uncharacterized protein n=1 Tax=Punica granatum TaxID=22663 RepID=A0A218XDH6_PUNGR|nr:hypothetical protein CDL15_Pgr012746 [Punica granatum]
MANSAEDEKCPKWKTFPVGQQKTRRDLIKAATVGPTRLVLISYNTSLSHRRQPLSFTSAGILLRPTRVAYKRKYRRKLFWFPFTYKRSRVKACEDLFLVEAFSCIAGAFGLQFDVKP